MNYWPRPWQWFWWVGDVPHRLPFPVRRILFCGKRRWYIRKGCDMRWPPSLTINNFVRVSDDAYAAGTGLFSRFSPFGQDVNVIGPWLSASFDNPLFGTGEPIMRLTLVGPPTSRVRTKLHDTYGSVITLADGKGGQQWEVVSTVEWTADGETDVAWVFCFCRPFLAGPRISGTTCPGAPTFPLGVPFSMWSDPATEGHAMRSTLAPGDYLVKYSIVSSAPVAPAFASYTGSCMVIGVIDPQWSGSFTVPVSAGNTLRLFFASPSHPATVYVTVVPPP